MDKDAMVLFVLLAILCVLMGTVIAAVIAVVSKLLAGVMLLTWVFGAVMLLDCVLEEIIDKKFGKEQD